jgi:hypothetical protein
MYSSLKRLLRFGKPPASPEKVGSLRQEPTYHLMIRPEIHHRHLNCPLN